MIVAGLDQGTTSGLAIFHRRTLVHWEKFRPPGETDAEIFHGFRIWWRAKLVSENVQHVAIEEPLPTNLTAYVDDSGQEQMRFGPRARTKKPISNMQTYLRLYGIRGHAIEICQALGIPCEEANSKTWRTAIYGPVKPPADRKDKSAWWKQHAIAHSKRVGWNIGHQDAAEAACIADWLAVQLMPAAAPDLFSTPQTERVTA